MQTPGSIPLRAARGADRPVTLRWASLRAISALILREMSTAHGRSLGGYLWVIVQPVAIILLLSIGFSMLLRSPSLGTSFLLFYASALLPLRMFQAVAQSVGEALRYNRALLSYPRVTFMDALLARGLLATLTQVTVSTIVLIGILAMQDIHEVLDPLVMLCALGWAALVGFGWGTLNACLSEVWPLYVTVWQTLNRPLILISGVFFTFEELPLTLQTLLWWNPIIHMGGLARSGIYMGYSADYISVTYLLFIALAPCALGLVGLRGFYRKSPEA